MLALTRQGVPTLRTKPNGENLSARGAYQLADADGEPKVSLLATGSEVALAIAARDKLQADGIGTRVVSMPCWELFAAQDADYRRAVLGPGTVRVGVEAASGFGWERHLGTDGQFVGMTGFGGSAPFKDLFTKFAITPDAVAAAARAGLET